MPVNAEKKLAGILVPTFALRHENDLGIGDTKAMQDAVDFCSSHGVGVLQILPINETGLDNTPYNAISAIALDPVYNYISPKAVPGLVEDDYNRIATAERIRKLRSGPVNYSEVKPLKEELLHAAFSNFARTQPESKSGLKREFDEFRNQNSSWLQDYCLFRTLMRENDENACWPDWEEPIRNYSEAAGWIDRHPESRRLLNHQQFLAFVQWICFRQWETLKSYATVRNVQLMGDIPFGVSRYSADVWSQTDLFDLDWSAGAPPEPLFQSDKFVQKWGQNWGMPVYDWQAHRRNDFSWWRRRVSMVGKFFHLFRIDHVLGFFRVYAFPWVPQMNSQFIDLSKQQAAEVTGGKLPGFLPHADEPEEFARKNQAAGESVLSMIIESAGDMGVVAEDLGVVPEYVRPALQKLGIPGFYIPQFERIEEDRSYKPQEKIPELAITTYATHDHEPLLAFWESLTSKWKGPDGHQAWLEIQRLMRFLKIDCNNPPETFTPELHQAFMRSILQSKSWLSIFMITDILCTSQRFNQPGSVSDSNWSERLDMPLAQYLDHPDFAPRLTSFITLVDNSGRKNSQYRGNQG